jgi:hypothetical protein
VKNLANDFRVIPTYIYAYQDKFKALPGDDPSAQTHLPGGTVADNGNGNGVIDGAWNSTTATDESFTFWRHVRLANLAAGPTVLTDAEYVPKNAVSGILGVSSTTVAQIWITGMTGTYQVCSKGILGKFAKQLDIQMDDGKTETGSMRAILDSSGAGVAVATGSIDEALPYTVCMTF